MAEGEYRKLALAMAAAVLAVSTSAPAIRVAEPLAPLLIASVRVTVTAGLLILPTRRAVVQAWRALARDPRAALDAGLAGLCLAAHFATWIASLSLTSTVRAVALVATQPLFAGLLARALGDRAPPRLFVGAVVALGGTALLASAEAGPGGVRELAWLGDLLAVAGAVTATAYLAFGRRVHQRLGAACPPEGYFVLVNCVAAACLWPLAAGLGAEPQPAGVRAQDYLALVWLALVPGVVGHGLLNWAVRRLPVHTVSLVVLLEPIGAAALAWALLGETVAVREGLGMLVLLGGVALGLPRPKAGPSAKPDVKPSVGSTGRLDTGPTAKQDAGGAVVDEGSGGER